MDSAPKRGRGRGRGGRGRGRGRGGGRGRGKKAAKVIESDEELDASSSQPEAAEEPQPELEAVLTSAPPPIDLEADISQLEAPTFTTINRGPPEPMLRLNWDHKVNLMGEKVTNPMIHCCDKCLKPILIYGRMIPCRHVFCLACGKKEHQQCPRCLENVSRVDQNGLGTVFMCTHGGSRYGSTGCGRTYLSQRDLQAHINHRHVSTGQLQQGNPSAQSMEGIMGEPERPSIRAKASLVNDPRSSLQPSGRRSTQIQSSGIRTNLITVPIQETAPSVVHEQIPSTQNYYTQYQQQSNNMAPTNYGQPLPPMHLPPPQPQTQYYGGTSYSPASAAYPGYGTAPTAQTQPQYVTPTVPGTTRVAQQYDYNAANTQWSNNQQYYR